MSNDSAAPTDLRATLARFGVTTAKLRGERLFEQGEVATGIYLIRSGHVAFWSSKPLRKPARKSWEQAR